MTLPREKGVKGVKERRKERKEGKLQGKEAQN
jgi:hypothetical protein